MSYSNAVFFLDPESGSDTRTALAAVTVSNPSGSITRCNKTAHGLITGAVVDLTLFSAWLNGAWKITVFDADNFDLDGAVWQATADTSGTATPRGGSSMADAWKTFQSGATAARVQGGDIVRVKASPDPTSLGQTAAWTNNSPTVTLNSAVTANICDCESAWTGSANVTTTADTALYRENTKSNKNVIAAGFTTGLVAFFATGTLDLSAYQQVSFWVRGTVSVAASTLSLRLCSDVAGVTTVHTIPIPAMPTGGTWVPITWDNGGALNSAIKSVALYADLDPGSITVYLDNIIACKASSSNDALTLNSLIGKVWNLNWAASTAYATNDIRKPTTPNRNGYRYKVTAGGGGNSGGSEPTWPQEIGATVNDGALTWTCEGLEDTWYPIASINGTTVAIDNDPATLPTALRGYPGATETVTTYKREPILQQNLSTGLINAGGSGSNVENLVGVGSGALGYLTYSGGWNRTDMTTRTGETWRSGQNCPPGFRSLTAGNYFVFDGFGITRMNYGFGFSVTGEQAFSNSHFVGNTTGVSDAAGNAITNHRFTGCVINNNGTSHGISYGNTSGRFHAYLTAVGLSCNTGSGINFTSDNRATLELNVASILNNGASGVAGSAGELTARNLVSANNVTAGITDGFDKHTKLVNCNITDATPLAGLNTGQDHYIYAQRWNQTANNHLITTDGGTISSSTAQRHTASGISWLFNPTSTTRDFTYPMRLSLGKIKCIANALVTMSIWTYRDSTDIKGRLLVKGGQLTGVAADVSVPCEPSINGWAQSSNLTFTPTEAGWIEIFYECWDGVGTTNNLWIDDLTVTG